MKRILNPFAAILLGVPAVMVGYLSYWIASGFVLGYRAAAKEPKP